MPCTTVLVGKNASYDGSTMIARTDDGSYDVKKVIVVQPKDQPKKYKSVNGHLEIELPDNPMRYTMCPNVDKSDGIWGTHGINAANVGMTATETITSNPRVMGVDPLVVYKKAKSKKEKDIPGGIGEEDLLVLVLPYIHSAKEGVIRLGSLLEKYGTYESNGIAFNDENDVWWLESIGGHHWIARRVPDDVYVMMPNQFGMDYFDFDDALNKQENFMCSADLKDFMVNNHLDLDFNSFNPRHAFGSHTDQDHIYNTPRAWFMGRYFNPSIGWDGPNAKYHLESDDIPWCLVPEKKVTIEDVKYVLSSHYQGTEYDPYGKGEHKGKYRSIGINRTGVTGILQIRPYVEDAIKAVEWITFGPNPFNVALPLYANVDKLPAYVSETQLTFDSNMFYWDSMNIAVMADAHYFECIQLIDRYQNRVACIGHKLINEYDKKFNENKDAKIIDDANNEICQQVKEESLFTLNKVLLESCKKMKCGYNRADN